MLYGRKKCAVPAVSVLSAASVYAALTIYLFHSELRGTAVARRVVELPQAAWVRTSPCCGDGYATPTFTDSSYTRRKIGDSPADRRVSNESLTAAHSVENETAVGETRENNKSGIHHVWEREVNDTESTGDGGSEKAHDVSPESNSTEQEPAAVTDNCRWMNLMVKGPPYFLTVVFIVRIYEKDLSEMTSAEVKQWLLFLRYAGVEHVYLYDLWYLPGESQREPLDLFIRQGYLTYLDRHELNPYVTAKSQLPSYQHCLDEFGKDTTWQAAIDIDEYPFSSEDTEPGFMYRYIKKFSKKNPDVSEITMNNFLYLGQKNKSRELLIEKLWRHTHGPSNKLVKPIYRPADMKRAQIHHNMRRTGHSRMAPSSGLRMNHYWGARLQNWGPDTPETLSNTEEDRGMEPIVAAFKSCSSYTNKYLL